MAYTKTNWVNDQTELNAENMNHIEDGIYNSQNVEIIAISDTAPTSCVTGDKYYNTTDNLIYTATGTNTWSEDGEEPIQDIFYILFSEQSSYSYDGTTLVSVGGGTEDIVISDTEPTEEGVKIWIDTGEISNRASEITNSYSTSTGIGYSANYVNHINTYSNTETQIGYWFDKPLYRKILTLPTLANNGETNVSYDSTYLIKRFEIYCENPAIAKISLNIPTNNYISSYIDYTNHRIAVQTSSDRTAFTNNYVIIEYTKTTD